METTAAPRLRSNHLWVAALCLGAAALLPAVSLLPHPQVVALSLVMVLILLAHVTFRRMQGSLDYFEVLIPFTMVQILCYGVGTYYLLENPKELIYQSLWAWLVPALSLAVLAYVGVATAYTFSFRRLRRSPLIAVRMVGLKPVLFLAGVGFLGQTAGILVERSLLVRQGVSGVLSAVQQLAPLFLSAWFLAWYAAWSTRASWTKRFLGPLLLLPQVAYAIYGTFGGKQFTITLIALPALAYWYVRRKLPLTAMLVVVLIAVFLVFPLYNTFRTQDRHLQVGERLDRAVSAAQHWDRVEYFERSLGAFITRSAVVTSPAAVIRSVPRWVDYQHGKTIAFAFLSFIPRVVWPDKPVMTTGKEFGHVFGLVNFVDVETQIACTLVGEMYWNFGVPGVVGWALFFGCACRWVYRRYGEGGENDGVRKALYVALLFPLVASEGQQALLIVAVVKTVLLFALTVWFLKKLGWLEMDEAALAAR